MKYLDIFIECLGCYFYLVLLLRFLGKKEMSKLSISDLIVFLMISELMTMSIANKNVSFVQSAIAALIVVIFDKLCSFLTLKYDIFRNLLEGEHEYIIYKGKIDRKCMARLKYSIHDLCHHLRQEGVASLSDVEFAILETDGNLSVVLKQENDVCIPEPLIYDGKMNKKALKMIHKDEEWLKKELKKKKIDDYHDIFYCILEKKGLYFIIK